MKNNNNSLNIYSNGSKLFANIESFNKYIFNDNNGLISYYDLLNLLSKDIHPKLIRFYSCNYSTLYYFSYEDGSYIIKNKNEKSERFSFYLNENLTESQCLSRRIEIIE